MDSSSRMSRQDRSAHSHTQTHALSAVLFDIGGVRFYRNASLYRNWEARLALLEGQLTEKIFNNPVALQATVGDATPDEAWTEVGRRLTLAPGELAALKRDTRDGRVWDTTLLDFARSLRSGYKTGTISDGWLDAREAVREYVNSSVFDVSVFSAEEGVRKPDPEIYRRALSRLGVAPQEAVFVDDRLKNVEGARRVGMHAIHFTDALSVREDIESLVHT